MEMKFKVHGLAEGTAIAKTEVDGEIVASTIPSFIVELVTLKERDGNLTLNFVGSGIAAARELFKRDAVITGTFKKA